MRYGLAGLLIISVLAALIALQNPQPAEVQFFVFEASGSAGLVLILTFGIGVAVGLLSTLPTYFRDRGKLKSLPKTLVSSPSDEDIGEARSGAETDEVGGASKEDRPDADSSERERPNGDFQAAAVEGSAKEESPKQGSPGEGSPTENLPPPPVGSDPPSRMRRDSWWGAVRERNERSGQNGRQEGEEDVSSGPKSK